MITYIFPPNIQNQWKLEIIKNFQQYKINFLYFPSFVCLKINILNVFA